MDVVFTNHAQERMKQRSVSKDMVLQAVRKPDRTNAEADGDTKFIRDISGRQIHVVCKPLPDEKMWLVKSVWVRGEDDRKATLLSRLFANRLAWIGLAVLILIIVIYVLTR